MDENIKPSDFCTRRVNTKTAEQYLIDSEKEKVICLIGARVALEYAEKTDNKTSLKDVLDEINRRVEKL
ncbi:MAG: hypothetical protein ABIC57_00130 [bacterium]